MINWLKKFIIMIELMLANQIKKLTTTQKLNKLRRKYTPEFNKLKKENFDD